MYITTLIMPREINVWVYGMSKSLPPIALHFLVDYFVRLSRYSWTTKQKYYEKIESHSMKFPWNYCVQILRNLWKAAFSFQSSACLFPLNERTFIFCIYTNKLLRLEMWVIKSNFKTKHMFLLIRCYDVVFVTVSFVSAG
jgi:hypothetical protein